MKPLNDYFGLTARVIVNDDNPNSYRLVRKYGQYILQGEYVSVGYYEDGTKHTVEAEWRDIPTVELP